MTVRTKYSCISVEKIKTWKAEGFTYKASFQAISSGSPENEKFFKYTPGGSITVQTYKDDVFEPGKSYYVDFITTEE